MGNTIKQIVKEGQTIRMIVRANERGPKGEQGEKGDTATIQAGEAYSVPFGQPPAVMNTGTSSNAVFDFYIPEGKRGEKGDTGAPGKDGKDGVDGKDGAIQYQAGQGISIDPATNTISATGGGGGDGVWGQITGNIADQTDLQQQFGEYTKTTDLAAVATSGEYSDLTGTPNLATVATSGSYDDLSDKPTIPTVNDATLTITHDGTTAATFTANSATNATANIVSPVQIASVVSEPTNVAYVGTNNLTDGAVTTAKIANEAVTAGARGLVLSHHKTGNTATCTLPAGTWIVIASMDALTSVNGSFLTYIDWLGVTKTLQGYRVTNENRVRENISFVEKITVAQETTYTATARGSTAEIAQTNWVAFKLG